MTDIKRYETIIGEVVKYTDHAAIVAALQEQVRALAAEAESLREQSEEVYAAGYNHGHLNTVDGIAYAPGTKDDFYPNALQVMVEVETSDTDAVIREIRGQAVEEFAKHLRGHMQDGSPLGLLAMGADEFAARIRSGEQP